MGGKLQHSNVFSAVRVKVRVVVGTELVLLLLELGDLDREHLVHLGDLGRLAACDKDLTAEKELGEEIDSILTTLGLRHVVDVVVKSVDS